ncbi:MAG: threonine ammonia-lyase [Alphaproteobacteria bacterium]|nr:threonine ammonia-lyase [Alphaproteobacteria bacterium]
MAPSVADIRAAAAMLEGAIVRTPLVAAPRLSALLGCTISLKLESMQYTGSFKDRGAYVKLSRLSPAEARAGVIAMSAGNHAQGVAYRARHFGVPAVIVMPESTPFGKVERTRDLGAEVVLSGDTIDAAAVTARELASARGLTFVHPYDDPDIIAGQGTVGLEMLADDPALEVIVVPVGGGGIISGIATATKALSPGVRVVAVEAKLFPSMYEAVHGMPATSAGYTIADGIAVKAPGALTRAIIERLVDDMLLVEEAALESAVHLLMERCGVVAEGAGAAALAGVYANRELFAGRRVGLVVTGGNIDARLYAAVLNRGLMRDGRLVRLRVGIVDQPGVLARVVGVIGANGGNIIDVVHQRLFFDVPVRQADVDIVVETRSADHVHALLDDLRAAGFPARVLVSRSSAP